MLQIQDIKYSKNPASVGEALLIYISLIEILASWGDLQIKTWDSLGNKTWEEVKLKYF